MEPTDSSAWREKAAAGHREAACLVGASEWDGAASRAYYAAYHALVAAFEERKNENEYVRHMSPTASDAYWAHDFVCNNAMLAGVPQPDRRFAKNLQRLRVQADYRPESVDPDDIKDKVAALGRFLKFLGVEAKT